MRGTQSMPNGFLPTRRAGAALVGKNPFGIALNPRAAATINQPLINHQSTFSRARKKNSPSFSCSGKNSASFCPGAGRTQRVLFPRRKICEFFCVRAGHSSASCSVPEKLDDFLSRRGKSSASSLRAGITPASFFSAPDQPIIKHKSTINQLFTNQ